MARRPSSLVNLARIAKDLDLSISTCSRALRNTEGIHPETRKRVLESAARLGYVMPGLQGPDLKARPHQILALAQAETPYSDQSYLSGMSRASVAMNLAILSHHVSMNDCSSVLEHDKQPVAMRAGMVEGIVLIHRWPDEIAAKLATRFPTVSIVHQYAAARIDHIGIDDRVGLNSLVKHLYGRKHRKIGFFGLCGEMSWSRSSFAAYVDALFGAGLAFNPDDVIQVTLQEASAMSAFPDSGWGGQIRSRVQDGVSAWIGASGAMGITLKSFLVSAGYSLPDQVAITSCHQPTIYGDNPSGITTISLPDEELGASALKRLVHRLQHPGESYRSILLPPTLIPGTTT